MECVYSEKKIPGEGPRKPKQGSTFFLSLKSLGTSCKIAAFENQGPFHLKPKKKFLTTF